MSKTDQNKLLGRWIDRLEKVDKFHYKSLGHKDKFCVIGHLMEIVVEDGYLEKSVLPSGQVVYYEYERRSPYTKIPPPWLRKAVGLTTQDQQTLIRCNDALCFSPKNMIQRIKRIARKRGLLSGEVSG